MSDEALTPVTSIAPSEGPTLSIGAVSQRTGIPVETLRTWERRYGFPSPQRTRGGHRKYSTQTVERLMLVQRALQTELRAADVLTKSVEELERLLEPAPLPSSAPAAGPSESTQQLLERWLRACLRFDEDTLQRELMRHWSELGAMRFIEERLSPFIEALGQGWYEGRVAVIHEQFASKQLTAFLTDQWRMLSDRNNGPCVICATLSGEFHMLGLQMSALVMALAGCRICAMEVNLSTRDIIKLTHTHDAEAVLVSVSATAKPSPTLERLTELRQRLPSMVTLIVGGEGAPDDLPGVITIRQFNVLKSWATRHYAQARLLNHP